MARLQAASSLHDPSTRALKMNIVSSILLGLVAGRRGIRIAPLQTESMIVGKKEKNNAGGEDDDPPHNFPFGVSVSHTCS